MWVTYCYSAVMGQPMTDVQMEQIFELNHVIKVKFFDCKIVIEMIIVSCKNGWQLLPRLFICYLTILKTQLLNRKSGFSYVNIYIIFVRNKEENGQ